MIKKQNPKNKPLAKLEDLEQKHINFNPYLNKQQLKLAVEYLNNIEDRLKDIENPKAKMWIKNQLTKKQFREVFTKTPPKERQESLTDENRKASSTKKTN